MRFRAGMLVPLQGTAAGCCLRAVVRGVCAFAAAGRCCRVPLQGVASNLLLEGAARKVAGAAAGVPAARCCRQSAGSVPLQGAAALGCPRIFFAIWGLCWRDFSKNQPCFDEMGQRILRAGNLNK